MTTADSRHTRPETASPAADTRTARQRVGDAAEALAARHLERAGLRVLERGFRRRIGELDLVCVEPGSGTIVFVEVRYRSRHARGGPLASVGAAKRSRLLRTARAWLQLRRVDPRRAARIDVIAIAPTLPMGPRGWPTAIEAARWQEVEGAALCWCRSAIEA